MDIALDAHPLDDYLPTYDVRSAHQIEVDASPDATFHAIKDMDLGRSPLVAALFAIRGLPHFLTGKARPSTRVTVDTFLDLGFTIFREDAPRELVMGTVGKFWLPTSGVRRVTASEFLAFDEPGYAKGIMAFTVTELGPGRSLLGTETRVASLDETARRRFAAYWRLIGPFSGVIRNVMLARIKRGAEARA